MERHSAVHLADCHLEGLWGKLLTMLLERAERVPGTDLLAINGDRERSITISVALEKSVEDHAEVVGRAFSELLEAAASPSSLWAPRWEDSVELVPEDDRSGSIV